MPSEISKLTVPLGFGLLRLGTEGRPDEKAAIALLHEAMDSGVRLFDTADSYCLDDKEYHYAERLLRSAIESWEGEREKLIVLTKAGMARPKGRWIPNARPEHLRKAVEGSLKAFGVERLSYFLLHANDPKTPFEASLQTLASLSAEGKIGQIGLCNVSVPEIWQAMRHFPVAVVQNEFSVMARGTYQDGVVELCARLQIPFLAHRPLGGHAKTANLLKNRAMAPIAKAHGCSPHQAALATLRQACPNVVPLIGATKVGSLRDSLAALKIQLSEAELDGLREKLTLTISPEVSGWLEPMSDDPQLRHLPETSAPGDRPEVVVLMGIQGAGKSSLVEEYVTAGYERLNRDLLGGSLEDLIPKLESLLSGGKKRVVLDNTYATRSSRFPVIRMAHQHGVPLRCRYLATPIAEAAQNVVGRILERYGRLLGPEELKEFSKSDPNLPPPAAMLKFAATFEAPDLDEGFGAVEAIPFVRKKEPHGKNRALLLDVDGTLRTTLSGEIFPRSPDDLQLLPARREVLEKWVKKGYKLFFVSNQSGVDSGTLSKADAEACFQRTIELLDLPVEEAVFCPHPAFPVSCFCRKPLPGMGVYLIRKYQLDRSKLKMVGDMGSDADFAAGLGIEFANADEFFSLNHSDA